MAALLPVHWEKLVEVTQFNRARVDTIERYCITLRLGMTVEDTDDPDVVNFITNDFRLFVRKFMIEFPFSNKRDLDQLPAQLRRFDADHEIIGFVDVLFGQGEQDFASQVMTLYIVTVLNWREADKSLEQVAQEREEGRGRRVPLETLEAYRGVINRLEEAGLLAGFPNRTQLLLDANEAAPGKIIPTKFYQQVKEFFRVLAQDLPRPRRYSDEEEQESSCSVC